ncbi:unnamed protein product [Leptidea sinapis]|uniref:Uncharacterized protein n=1 Tax=Leptidea sinapis TaxID=189913 RepID=A0A5E4Q3L0_9NEOP|nr:unnamed protein product [Leptidea sinapis]
MSRRRFILSSIYACWTNISTLSFWGHTLQIDTILTSCLCVSGCLDVGCNIIGKILRHLQTTKVKKMADSVPRLQNDSYSMDSVAGIQLAYTHRIQAAADERKWL